MHRSKPSDLDQNERKKIIEFLESHPVGVLACIDVDGGPHASTIYFTVDDALNITFTTKHDTAKYANLTKNNKVMLVAFDAPNQSAVQISGHATEVTDPEAAHKAFHGTLHATQKTGQDTVPPIAKLTAGAYVAFTIHPDYIQLSEYGWGNNFVNALRHANDAKQTGDPA